MRKFNFTINTPPDEITIDEFHKTLARLLIKKYGEKTMKEVVKIVED